MTVLEAKNTASRQVLYILPIPFPESLPILIFQGSPHSWSKRMTAPASIFSRLQFSKIQQMVIEIIEWGQYPCFTPHYWETWINLFGWIKRKKTPLIELNDEITENVFLLGVLWLLSLATLMFSGTLGNLFSSQRTAEFSVWEGNEKIEALESGHSGHKPASFSWKECIYISASVHTITFFSMCNFPPR